MKYPTAAHVPGSALTAACGALGLLIAVLAPASPVKAAVCKRTEVPTLIVSGLSAPARVWCVAPALSGRKLRDRAPDISAIACVSETLCAVVSDETRFAQIVDLDRTRHEVVPRRFVYLGDTPVTRKGNDRKDPPEFDVEAAGAVGKRVVLIGSHSVSQRGEKVAERGQVFGFDLDGSRLAAWPAMRRTDDSERKRADGVVPVVPADASAGPTLIDRLVDAVEPEKDDLLHSSRGRCLQDNGFNIEGMDFSATDVVIGLRGPVDDGKAILLSADRDAFLGGRIERAQRHVLDLGIGVGIRSLLPLGSGFLLISGRSQPEPVDDGPCAAFPQGAHVLPALYYWGGPARPDILREVGRFSEKRHKPEAMLLLGMDSSRQEIELLVFFDGTPDGAPTSYRIPFAE